MSGQVAGAEMKAQNHSGMLLVGLLHSLLAYTIQDHLSRGATTPVSCALFTSITNQEHALQACSQDNLRGTFSQLRFPLRRYAKLCQVKKNKTKQNQTTSTASKLPSPPPSSPPSKLSTLTWPSQSMLGLHMDEAFNPQRRWALLRFSLSWR